MMNSAIYRLAFAMGLAISIVACTTNNDNAHTTATTYVSPPPHQVLTIVPPPANSGISNANRGIANSPANLKDPLLVVNLQEGTKFRRGEPVPLDFTISNAKLKDKGGAFRVRYIIDDGAMNWIDDSNPVWLSGWVPGEHTIRVELIGPDGWPYKNGDANIVTRKILVTQ